MAAGLAAIVTAIALNSPFQGFNLGPHHLLRQNRALWRSALCGQVQPIEIGVNFVFDLMRFPRCQFALEGLEPCLACVLVNSACFLEPKNVKRGIENRQRIGCSDCPGLRLLDQLCAFNRQFGFGRICCSCSLIRVDRARVALPDSTRKIGGRQGKAFVDRLRAIALCLMRGNGQFTLQPCDSRRVKPYRYTAVPRSASTSSERGRSRNGRSLDGTAIRAWNRPSLLFPVSQFSRHRSPQFWHGL
ncbi:hypothetical protein D2T31_18695 [Sinirhodobacter populi]|uniref:Uncharacterized protein n=1 Tax=Paenirhodobacter populi TaxID=2306993 RepID=A0A443K266_9RHOB|nr:hypothetical protein [Sinirhodobacter populi]RWR26861.1 hypothetical protein D2T31_18695 [Sinirhodobacter populi]